MGKGQSCISTSSCTSTQSHNSLHANLGGEVLLLVGTKSVARGKVLQSRVLHGKEVPADMTAISICEVMEKKCPLQFLMSFDDERKD